MKEILESVEKEIEKRNITENQIAEILKQNKDIINRRIVGGMASVAVVDRENQKIPVFALKKAVERFMQNNYYRIVTVFHSDISVGRILPKWTNPETGETMKTEVTDIGWKVCAELRDDIEIANKVWDEILKGNIRSFSIAGSSKEKLQKQENGISFEQINDLDLYECALCEVPVVPLAKFEILWNPQEVKI